MLSHNHLRSYNDLLEMIRISHRIEYFCLYIWKHCQIDPREKERRSSNEERVDIRTQSSTPQLRLIIISRLVINPICLHNHLEEYVYPPVISYGVISLKERAELNIITIDHVTSI